MARMICKCGASLGTSASPSPCSLSIYYGQEVQSAVIENPNILLSDFLTDWDATNEKTAEFMKRSKPVEYWYCTSCQRVYEIEIQIGGHCLRTYQRTEVHPKDETFEDWTQIYVLKDTDTDAALEKSTNLLLSDYLEMTASIRYLLSPDEKTIVAMSPQKREIQFTYSLETIAER